VYPYAGILATRCSYNHKTTRYTFRNWRCIGWTKSRGCVFRSKIPM